MSSAILIDYNQVIGKKDRPVFLQDIIVPKSSKGFSPGLVLIVPNQVIAKLNDLPLGDQRVEYLFSLALQETQIYFLMYNPKRNICIIDTSVDQETNIFLHIKLILSMLTTSLPAMTMIWINIDLQSKNFISHLSDLVKDGFENPYISSLTPMYTDIPTSLILSRLNTENKNINLDLTINAARDAIEQFKNNDSQTCNLYAKLTAQAVKFLQSTARKNPHILESQKELTGELYVRDIIQEVDKNRKVKFIYLIDINKSSVESGEEENVNVAGTRYNFHSHPHEAYVRHSVKYAWPSVTDFLGYYHLGINTIFHCVATLEGVYIMSFAPYWGSNLSKVSKKFIDKNYEIDHKTNNTPEKFVQKVNSILYKGYPIFHLKFFPWENAQTVFKVSYSQINQGCIADEKSIQNYKKMYKSDL